MGVFGARLVAALTSTLFALGAASLALLGLVAVGERLLGAGTTPPLLGPTFLLASLIAGAMALLAARAARKAA